MNLPQQKLIQYTDSLYEESISVLKKYEPPEGYRVAFSGGKDSIVVYQLCVDAGVKFTAHYSMTTIDPPEVTKFIREHYPDVIWDRPYYKGNRTNFYQLVERKGLPVRMRRWCCEYLKENNSVKGGGEINVTGVRHEESAKRAQRPFKSEFKGCVSVNPIIHWTSNDVWDFIHSRHLPYPSLYDEGHKRLGCILCPLACRKARIRDYNEYPNVVKAIERAFDKYKETHPDAFKVKGKDSHEIVYWWVHESPINSAKGQCLSNFINEKDDNE